MKKSLGTKSRSVSPKNSRKMNDCQKVAKKEEEGINCFGSSDIEDNLTNDLSIYVQFAVYLCYSNKLDKFEIWFNNISKCNSSLLFELMKNEDFCLCIVRLRFFQKKYELVFKLLKSGPFSAREDYVKLWEDAHYKQKEVALGQPLTPLQRFRVRKKFPPPANICPFGRQIINPLFKEASITLKRWFQEHSTDPYPSIKEKQQLAQQTGLTLYQVKTWFANTRRRKKVRQMQSSLQRHKLLNKSRFLLDSEQLVKESRVALDLSIRNIEMKGDPENVLTDQVGGMNKDAGCLLEQNVEKADVNLRGESPDKKGHEKGQSGSKSSHSCCRYCPEFGEDPLNQTDHNVQQSGPSSKTGTFPNMNLRAELSDEQNSTNVPNSSGGTKSSDLFNLLLSQQMLLEVNLQKNANYFKPFSSLEEPTKSMNHPQSEVRVQILNKTTYSPSHFPSFNASLQQQVETSHAVPIPPPTPFLISLTNTTQTLPESVCPSTTIYPIPVVTTPGDPPMNIGAFRQDGSYPPGNQNSFKSSTLLSQGIQNTTFQDNSDSYAKMTEQESDPAYLNLTPSGASEYPLPGAPCPATETLAFAVACPLLSLPNNIAPLSKPPATSINSHFQIIPISNLQPVQMKNEGWNQLTRSCDPSPSTSHNTLSLETSMSQMPQSLGGVTGMKEIMNLENEIAHALLRLSRKGNDTHMQNQGQ